MRITFQQQSTVELQKDSSVKRNMGSRLPEAVISSANNSAGVYMGAALGDARLVHTGKGKSMIELQQEAGNIDVGILQDYMTLMSNTMGEEDYAKLQEQGFDFGEMSPEEAVTIVDKIKAELLRSGVRVRGYTDNLSADKLAEALGSEALAKEIAEGLAGADVPVSEENIAGIERACRLAQELVTPDEGAVRYLIDNRLEPTLWNLYLAQNSGSNSSMQGDNTSEWTGLTEEIDKALERAGYEKSEENREHAAWLVENRLALTKEGLDLMADLKGLELPPTGRNLAQGIAAAILEGRSPMEAGLAAGQENIYEKALRVADFYLTDNGIVGNIESVTARRQLEEIRLRMTAEVNVRLLRSGFSIDTAPMEQLLDALRQAEREVADSYFPQDEASVEKYRIYERAQQVVRELPALPIATIGREIKQAVPYSTEQFYEEGIRQRAAYDKAGERYETLMTGPRADLGDSIRKAFGNIDDILDDLGITADEEHRRAVRILGYNRMSIDSENVEKVITADRQVRTIIEKLNPAGTLQLIRDGVNPLEKSFGELEEYLQNRERDFSGEAEDFRRFLFHLEHRGEITEEERSSFVGIYRLIRQIEKTDGAAIGALVNAQAELHFSNLLSAVRSGKFGHFDVKVDDTIGAVVQVIRQGGSISEQIARAYNEAQLNEYREAMNRANRETVAMLERGAISPGVENILAAEAILTEDNIFSALRRYEKEKNALWEKLDEEAFEEEYEAALGEVKENLIQECFTGEKSSVDIRRLKLVHKQLSICSGLGERQEFFMPMQVGNRLARVHLTIKTSGEQTGMVNINVKLEEDELEAEFYFEQGLLKGNITEFQNKLMRSEGIADNFIREAGKSWKIGEVKIGPLQARIAEGVAGTEAKTENQELYRVAKVFLATVGNGEVYENQL